MTSEYPSPSAPNTDDGTDVPHKVQVHREHSSRRSLDEKLSDEERNAFYDYSSPRSMAIVLAAIVENHLTNLIQLLMVRDVDIARELFHPSGPLGPFGTKIRLAYMLRIISAETYRDLVAVNKIRNKFAHDLSVVDFDDKPVKDWIQNMHIYGIVREMAAAAQTRLDSKDFENRTKDFIAAGFMASATDAYRACLRFLIHSIIDQEAGIVAAEAEMNKKD